MTGNSSNLKSTLVIGLVLTSIALGIPCPNTLAQPQVQPPQEPATARRTVETLSRTPEHIDRSPVDLVIGPTSNNPEWIATVNQTSNSVSLVDLNSASVLHELPVGEHPTAIALHPDGAQVFVSSSYAGTIHALKIQNGRLEQVATWDAPGQPTGLAITPDGNRLMVAMTDRDAVHEFDIAQGKILRIIPVGRWPRSMAISKEGDRMVVGTSGDRGISIVDLIDGKTVHIDRFVGLNIGHMQLSSNGQHVYFPWMVYRRNSITEGNIRLGWVMASRLGRIGFSDDARREAISLDPPRQAVADPHGICLTSNDSHVVMSASGTHELLVLRIPELPFEDRGSTDHIPRELLNQREGIASEEDRFYRIEVGGRPLGIRMDSDNRTVYVANYLDNSIQIVDIVDRKVKRRIDLGGPPQPSLIRRGEAIFYDARRSLDQWYSCHSCHYLGGTNSVAIDTMNDGTPYTFKTVLPLYQCNDSGPWTWHGWQSDYMAAMKHSLQTTMLGPTPTDEDAEAIGAFLASLKPPPNYRSNLQNDAAARGERLFRSLKSGCQECHSNRVQGDKQIHDLGLGVGGDAYTGFNTPSLQGVFRKVLLMHDGRYDSLEEVLKGVHAPERVNGERLEDNELADLIEYLRTR
jgi:YVTN family beta-propeller protein